MHKKLKINGRINGKKLKYLKLTLTHQKVRSFLLPLTLISGLVLPLYFNTRMEMSLQQNILHVWIPALLGSSPAIGVVLIWHYLAPPTNWLHILGVISVTAVVTLAGAWLLSLDAIERIRFKRLLFPRAIV